MDATQGSTTNNVVRRLHLDGENHSANIMRNEPNEEPELEEMTTCFDNGDGPIELNTIDKGKAVVDYNFTPNVRIDQVPIVGMEYNTYDEAYDSYNMYAKVGGFSIRKHTSKKSNGERSLGLLVCSKEGFKRNKSDHSCSKIDTRCGCKARMVVKLCPHIQKWVVQVHEMEHNHLLHSPSKMHMHRSSKGLDTTHKEMVELWSKSGLRTYQIMDVMSYAVNGIQNVPFNEEDVYAYLREEKKSYFGKDCQFALRFFQEKSFDNTNFFYFIQTNEKNEVLNCFWVDAIAREDYLYFGDVVSFDTTYKKNKYLMPFAPFTGVNHHNQSIIFGCALLGDEKKESFKWLFNEWLRAMSNKPPGAIITDQDPAMKAAIREVFPNTVHRCCKWHIQQNAPKNANILYRLYEDFSKKMYAWFNLSSSKDEFEERWREMNELYPEIVDNKWLNDLWEDRASWASHYSPETFIAGMSTAQRSESMNKMFKKWVNARTPLHLFVEQFDQALARRRFKEKKYDYQMKNGVKHCSFLHPLAIHVRDIYTPSIFTKFEEEFRKLMYCHTILQSDFEGKRFYKVIYFEQSGKEKIYMLRYCAIKKEVSNCSCYLWSFAGIVCCHMLEVLKVEKVHELPKRYILKRWTRDIKIGSTNPFSSAKTTFIEETSVLHKKHVFSSVVNACLNEALKYEDTYNEAIQSLGQLSIQLKGRNAELDRIVNSASDVEDLEESIDMEVTEVSVGQSLHTSELCKTIRSTDTFVQNDIVLCDREIVRAKGCGKRIESGINKKKPKRICKTCQRSGHDSRICPLTLKNNNPIENVVFDKPIRRCKVCNGVGHDKRNCDKIAGTSEN